MTGLDASYYRRGDKVKFHWGWDGELVHGRVIGSFRERELCISQFLSLDPQHHSVNSSAEHWYREYVKVAFSLPNSLPSFSKGRELPAGMPVYWTYEATQLDLRAHDPGWDPYKVEPFLTPCQYAVMARNPHIYRPSQYVGAYLHTGSYTHDDPVWVWEEGWQRAVVIGGHEDDERRWVPVRYVGSYRDRQGHSSKSYRAINIWPVICDWPKPIQDIQIDPDWHVG